MWITYHSPGRPRELVTQSGDRVDLLRDGFLGLDLGLDGLVLGVVDVVPAVGLDLEGGLLGGLTSGDVGSFDLVRVSASAASTMSSWSSTDSADSMASFRFGSDTVAASSWIHGGGTRERGADTAPSARLSRRCT